MKKNILILFLIPLFSFSQFSFGVKGGLNVDSKNNITAYIVSIKKDINIYLSRGGINYGGYLQYDFKKIFVRAEYNRTRIKNDHDIPHILVRTDKVIEEYTIKKKEVPLILGFKASEALNIYAGNKIYRRSSEEFNGSEILETKNQSKNKFLFGLGLSFPHFSITMQYEPAPSETTVPYLDNPIGNKTQYINTEGSFWVLGVTLDLFSFF